MSGYFTRSAGAAMAVFCSSRRRHTRFDCDWSSDVCSSDLSQANLISSILFGDGAAAVIVRGNPGPGPKILISETYTFPDSLFAMGFDLRDSGFHIILDKDVPEMIGGKIRGLVEGFLERNGRKKRSEERRVGKEGRSRWSPYH